MQRSAPAAPATGAYQRWLTATGLLFLPFVVGVLVNTAQFRGLQTQAALEQATTARRLVAGQGYTTPVVTPRSLAYNPAVTAHPDLRQAPLSVLPAAILVKAIGEREGRTLAFASLLAWLTATYLAFAVCRILFGPGPAVLCALLLCLSPTALSASVSADSRTWAMAWLLLTWLALCLPQPGLSRAALAGLFAALAALTAYSLALPLLVAILPALGVSGGDEPAAPAPRRSLAGPLVGLAVVVLVAAPWLVRNQRVAGTPLPGVGSYALMSFTAASPGRSIERRYVDPGASPLGFFKHHQKQAAEKLTGGLARLSQSTGQALDGLLVALFVGALLTPLAGSRGRARNSLVWAVLAHALLLAMGSQEWFLLVVWAPLLALFAAWATAERLAVLWPEPVRRWGVLWSPDALRRWAVVGLLVVLASPGLAPQMYPPRRPPAEVAGPGGASSPNLKLLAASTQPTDVVMTDDPWRVAWETDRTAIWLAQTPEDLEAIHQAQPVSAIYFTQRALPGSGFFGPDEVGPWWSWAQAMPLGYRDWAPLQNRVPGERLLTLRAAGG